MFKCCKCGQVYSVIEVELQIGESSQCSDRKCHGELVIDDDDDIDWAGY